ncbi:MAG: hypothetical protein ACI4JK_05310 [Oscillospiraceae bacterium]
MMIDINNPPTKHYIGHAVMTGVEETFEFDAPTHFDKDEIESEMVDAFWESGLVDVWYEECEE